MRRLIIKRFKKPKASNAFAFETNRDKLTSLVLEKITFLDIYFNAAKSKEERERIKGALQKLENLLKLQSHVDENLSDNDYESMKNIVHQTTNSAIADLK